MAPKRNFATMSSNAEAADAAGVDVSSFEDLNTAMIKYDETREKVIKDSRDIQKLSKQAIYSLHRGDLEEAEKKLNKAEELAKMLGSVIEGEPTLRYGSYANALEEWAEGKIFQGYLRERRILRPEELPICQRDEYLGGVLDFTGELNRFAVAKATTRDTAAVQHCRDLVDTLMGVFLQFDFRNGSLRKKFDSLKYTLKKMETTLYEMSLTERLGFQRAAEDVAEVQLDNAAVDE